MKRKLCLLALLCLFRMVYGQQASNGLAIGDRVPEVVVKGVINYSTSELKLSDLKGRLVILDFWATWCSPCLAAFPKTDSLRKSFGDKLFILPVTYQSKADVEKVFARSKKLSALSIPMAVGDKTLHDLFPHRELPHYVWIDASGRVAAITGPQEVSYGNISKMLAEGVSMRAKVDPMKDYSPATPFLIQDLGITRSHIRFQSLLTDYVDGVASRMDIERDVNGQISRIAMVNAWSQWLFALAWSSDTLAFKRNRIALEVKDPKRLISHAIGEPFKDWLKGNGFCYELSIPPHLGGQALEIMRKDLERLFPQYKASIEKRKMQCLALVRTSANDKIKSTRLAFKATSDAFGLTVEHAPMRVVVRELSRYLMHLDTPLVDASGYTSTVDISFEADLSSPEAIRHALKKYDLDLVAKEALVDVLVISDTQ